MTEDKKAIRLSKAAHEFNVGIQTIVDFLHKKGIEISHDPNGKIPPEAYTLILKEYSSDLSVKKDAEKLALKEKVTLKKSLSIDDMETVKEGDSSEPDEDFLITDISGLKKHIDLHTEVKKTEIKTVGKIDLTPPAKTVKKDTAATPEKTKAPEPAAPKVAPAEPEAETVAPKKEPTVVGKVDLGKLTGKPEKGTKTTAPAKTAREADSTEPVAEPVAEPPAAVTEPPEAPVIAPVTHETKEAEIYRPGYEKLTGPKIIDKIELVTEVKKTKEQVAEARQKHDDRKKRERIKAKPREKVALDQTCLLYTSDAADE